MLRFSAVVAIFYAGDELHGDELFAYDPASGVYLVSDINPGTADGSPSYLSTIGQQLFMSAMTPEHGRELMVFDTAQPELGTQLVADLYSGPDSSFPIDLFAGQDSLYLLADDGIRGRELRVHDSVSGQIQLLDINVDNVRLATQPSIMQAYESNLYFRADSGGTHAGLWVHDPACLSMNR